MLGIYTRLSKDDPESNSPEHQLNEGKKFYIKKGFKNYNHYDEGIGKSGGLKIHERPALQSLVDDIKSGLIKCVWMRDQFRLERDTITFHQFAEICSNNKIDVYFGDNPKVDYNNPNSILQGSLMSAFSQYTRTQQSYSTKKSLLSNLKEGKVHGVIPYGYTKDENRKMVIDKDEAIVIKLIFKMSLNGHGYGAIANELNNRNIQTRYKKLRNKNNIWDKGTIQTIIRNKIYKGVRIVANETYKVDNILEPFYYDKVLNHLKENMTSGEKKVQHPYLLNGVNVCGVCNKDFNGRVVAVNGKYHYYQCVTKRKGKYSCGNLAVRLNIVEDIIWGNYFKNKYILKLINSEYNKIMAQVQATKMYVDIEQDYEVLNDLKIQKKNVVLLRASNELTAGEVREALDSLENDMNNIREVIYDKNQTYQVLYNSLDDFVDNDADFNEVDKVKKFEDKQSLIKKYIKKITITKNPEENTKMIIDFIAPNIDSHSIEIHQLYKWYRFNNKKIKI
jgi:site-specific DNA recombinase